MVYKIIHEQIEPNVTDATIPVQFNLALKHGVPLYQTLKHRSQDQGLKSIQIIQVALKQYLST